jgi:hypothetical protein
LLHSNLLKMLTCNYNRMIRKQSNREQSVSPSIAMRSFHHSLITSIPQSFFQSLQGRVCGNARRRDKIVHIELVDKDLIQDIGKQSL